MKKISPLKIVDFLNRRCDAATREEVLAWIAESGENQAEFFRIKKIWTLKNTYKHASEAEVEGFVRKFNGEVAMRTRTRRLRLTAWFSSSAAAVLAGVLLSIGIGNYARQTRWHTIANTEQGEVMKFSLEDGTRVFLNKGSELAYREDFNTRKRNVKLNGEAFFEVTSDPVHPFTVETEGINIRVLGTSFNVKTGNSIETVLEKGRVALETAKGQTLATLAPGQRAVVDAGDGELTALEEVATGKYTGWRFNHTVYDKISFSEVIRLIEEKHGVSILYDPEAFDQTAYRLVLNDDETLEEMLEILNLISPTDYTVQGNHVMLKKKK